MLGCMEQSWRRWSSLASPFRKECCDMNHWGRWIWIKSNWLNFRYIPENDGRSNDILYIYTYIYIYSMYYAKSAKCHDIRRGVTPCRYRAVTVASTEELAAYRKANPSGKITLTPLYVEQILTMMIIGLHPRPWFKITASRAEGEKDGDGKRCKVTGDFSWGLLWKMAEIDENDDIPIKKTVMFHSYLKEREDHNMGLSENSVPLNPIVNDHYPVFKWLFHWEYTIFRQTHIS